MLCSECYILEIAMLTLTQTIRLVLLSLALWAAATLYIRFLPAALTDSLQGNLGFATTLPVAWFSVWLVKISGRLTASELIPGVAVVGAVAMMIDGAALRWQHQLYGSDETAVRLGAAWLLWGYGVSLAAALAMAARARRLETR
jgi:hypothetical protein